MQENVLRLDSAHVNIMGRNVAVTVTSRNASQRLSTDSALADVRRNVLLLQNERMGVLQNLLRQLMKSMAVFDKRFEAAFVDSKLDARVLVNQIKEVADRYEENMRSDPSWHITPCTSSSSESDE